MPKLTSSAPASPKADGSTDKQAQQKTVSSQIPEALRQRGPSGRDVLLFLITSRLLNALVVQTFFQPDEYFQSLEPAWDLAFGSDAGAWITWVWP
jgi:GPI mannosyltransferase 3